MSILLLLGAALCLVFVTPSARWLRRLTRCGLVGRRENAAGLELPDRPDPPNRPPLDSDFVRIARTHPGVFWLVNAIGALICVWGVLLSVFLVYKAVRG